jgi:hypothetical protein
MRFSPTESVAPEGDIAPERRVVERVIQALAAPSVPFSPAEKSVIVARGIFDDDLAPAVAIVTAR